VPFLFLSTAGNHPDINGAYDLSSQGYFIKSATVDGIEEMLKQIVGYWSLSHTPTVLSK
jgi:DNA-binding NarL/FixJ family response regulator